MFWLSWFWVGVLALSSFAAGVATSWKFMEHVYYTLLAKPFLQHAILLARATHSGDISTAQSQLDQLVAAAPTVDTDYTYTKKSSS